MNKILTIEQAISAIKQGNKSLARSILAKIIEHNPRNEDAWLLLSDIVDNQDQATYCIKRVLKINPNNESARKALTKLSIPMPDSIEARHEVHRPSYIPSKLTEQQVEAILHEGSPLLIIAGPGSGKTEVISWRVAHLVLAGLVRSENLLVTTFTNKAALELKDRIQQKLPEINVELMQVSTIHSFCAELLRNYRQHTPLPHGLRILDDTGQFLFIYSNRKALGLDSVVKGRPYDFYSSVVRTFNIATEELVKPEDLEEWCRENIDCCPETEADLWEERGILAQAYRKYCELLLESELVDFAFLQGHTLSLLRDNSPLLEKLRDQYQEILIDEYQDTNAAQDQILALLAGNGQHLTVVGDDDQSIYRFRGATVRNILSFPERFPGTKVVQLPHNFRSRDPIVEHSLRVIDHNPARFPKSLMRVRKSHTDILLVHEHTAQEEAQRVASMLGHLYRIGMISRYGDVAILLRSVRSYASPYIDALNQIGIPNQVIGDASFFEREEIAQLYDLFNFLGASKPWGDRFVRNELVGLTHASQKALKVYKNNLLDVASDEGLIGIGITQVEDRQKLKGLLELKQKVQAQKHKSMLEVFYELLASTGCIARFELNGDDEILANLGLMSRLISSWDAYGSSNNFYPFQQYNKLLKDGGVDPIVVPPEDAVQVMTIHQAKGLEFPVVVLGAAMDGRLPCSQRRERHEIPHEMRASGPPEVEDPHLVDERKLFYVAITRARDLLIIGTADVVNKRGGGPSRFLYEMFGDDLNAVTDLTKAYIEKIESRPETRHKPKDRYSFSDLAYYLQCPMRYKFAVVHGLMAPWQDPVHFGANVHRALEELHRRILSGQIPHEDEVVNIITNTWIPSRRIERLEEEAYKEAAIKQLQRYISDFHDSFALILKPESPFSFSLDDRILIGKIDLIRTQNGEEVELVDFKTSKTLSAEIEGIDFQLDIYALGAESSLGHNVIRQTAHFLGDGQTQTWEWSSERRDSSKNHLSELLSLIEKGDFTPRTEYCLYCSEYRHICPHNYN